MTFMQKDGIKEMIKDSYANIAKGNSCFCCEKRAKQERIAEEKK